MKYPDMKVIKHHQTWQLIEKLSDLGCAIKQCGRSVMDGLFTEDEVRTLLNVFKKGLQYGQSTGGASILDLHSGALSMGERFVNVFTLLKGKSIWTQTELAAYV